MPDTNINAYEMEVQEKALAAQRASQEWQVAKDRFEDKKRRDEAELSPPEQVAPEVEPSSEEDTDKSEPDSKSSSLLRKNK